MILSRGILNTLGFVDAAQDQMISWEEFDGPKGHAEEHREL